MNSSTPFFPAFAKLLFGRPPADCAAQKLAEMARSENAIGELASTFGRFFGERLALAPKRDATDGPASFRKRRFTPQITFWAFLLQVLAPEGACREAVRRVQLWWRERNPKKTLSADTGAYCRARLRLPLAWLEELHEALASRLTQGVAARQLWCERRVKIIDGTTLSMPDTEANQDLWPQPKAQKPGCGFPLMRMVGLFCLSSGALLRAARGDKHQAEARLTRALLCALEKGDVLLGDRGFCAYALIARLLAREVDSVMRLYQRRKADQKEGKRLGKGDRLLVWKRPPRYVAGIERESEDYDTIAPELRLRLVRWRTGVKGFRTQEITLVTTLLDPRE